MLQLSSFFFQAGQNRENPELYLADYLDINVGACGVTVIFIGSELG